MCVEIIITNHLFFGIENINILPNTTPIERRIMNGRLLPKLDLQRSERDPIIGVRKNPIKGDKHQIRVICSCSTPTIRN